MRPVVRKNFLNIEELKLFLNGQTVVSIQPVTGSPLDKI
ncbi:N-acetylmannosamine-6-phosphate 2-epimerase, partial [Vibrio anguillarum]|nr:N-acetylmannosamine-6-phosphate 2-epimerase [Vibrio anguillarum]